MRKLASVQKVDKIWEHPNAERLNLVRVLGWQCVSNKENNFREGDKVIYLEIDSVLPDGPEWSEFLRGRKFRVKTIKLRGEISQGLVMPLNILPERQYEVGQDVTDLLGVTKYAPPEVGVRLAGDTAGLFPAYVNKTDETRLQSVLGVLKELEGQTCYITVKMDGTSSTFSHHNGETQVCSRTRALKEGDSVWWRLEKKYNILNSLKEFGNVAVQGEICGPGIQKNKMGLRELDLFVFDVFDINEQSYFNYNEFIDFCNIFGLQTVPIVRDDYTIKPEDDIQKFLHMAKGKYPNGHPREGIVVRPLEEMYSDRLHGRTSFKVINNDFLLKEK